ncbi:MAG: penicillin-binding transpeptidase domain-containing protein [Gemmatimonadaceae bacterium]
MPRPHRLVLIHALLIVFVVALVGKAAQLQLWQRHRWAEKAQRQHFADAAVPAPRGSIFDAAGHPLAESHEYLRISIAPKELRDRRAAAQALAGLRVSRSLIRTATDSTRSWLALPGHFLPGDAARLTALQGVYPEPAIDRSYTSRDATRRVIGRLSADGTPLEGIELVLDSLLRGRAGHATLVRSARGTHFDAPLDTAVAPRPGDDVVLTINQELQEIAERTLADAVVRMHADGGDIVIMDPSSGEIRAMSSSRTDPRSTGSPAVSEPFEPGSALKPFLAARLLSLGRATPDDVVNTENGFYTIEGRQIEDDHKFPSLTLRDVIRWSSNIGIVKFASRLSRREEFEALRDAGFGTATGVPYPAESRGTLRPPGRWSRQSPASLAMGYEIAVTPLQLVAAYAAIGNGGELLEPALVKEVRSPDGRILYRHERRVVRRVMSRAVAESVGEMLRGVVEGGTAMQASLGSFEMAGKTGTARRTEAGHGYAKSHYTASFAGFFPAKKAQYAILVKLDNPRGEFFAGKTAAPISKALLEAAIAARDAALDRRALAVARPAPVNNHEATEALAQLEPSAPYIFALPAEKARVAPPAALSRAVPDVHGLPMREAVFALHRAGFRVQADGYGAASGTQPGAGTLIHTGAVIRLSAGGGL